MIRYMGMSIASQKIFYIPHRNPIMSFDKLHLIRCLIEVYKERKGNKECSDSKYECYPFCKRLLGSAYNEKYQGSYNRKKYNSAKDRIRQIIHYYLFHSITKRLKTSL